MIHFLHQPLLEGQLHKEVQRSLSHLAIKLPSRVRSLRSTEPNVCCGLHLRRVHVPPDLGTEALHRVSVRCLTTDKQPLNPSRVRALTFGKQKRTTDPSGVGYCPALFRDDDAGY